MSSRPTRVLALVGSASVAAVIVAAQLGAAVSLANPIPGPTPSRATAGPSAGAAATTPSSTVKSTTAPATKLPVGTTTSARSATPTVRVASPQPVPTKPTPTKSVTTKPAPKPVPPKPVPTQPTPPKPVPTKPVPTKPVDCRLRACVALTFDDGPGPYTQALLDMLAAKKVRATFFVLGRQLPLFPKVVTQTAAAGHEIGNHTRNHRLLTFMAQAAVKEELRYVDDYVTRLTGRAPTVVRPPFGEHNRWTDAVIAKPIVLWNVDTRDWATRNTLATIAEVRRSAKPGSIILMHDVHRSTVAAVPTIIAYLQAKGYALVTVSELLRSRNPKPHLTYRSLQS